MKNRKIFIAINLPEEVKRGLALRQEKIGEMFVSDFFDGRVVRWTKKDNLHITLVFIGNADDQETGDVCEIVKEVVSTCPEFFLKLNRICYGPPADYSPEKGKAPRMVWVEGEKSTGLALLKTKLEKALVMSESSAHQDFEARAFSPHITLGRIKQWAWRKIEPEERPDIEEEVSFSFDVRSVEVMESQLKRGGPQYEILESVDLKSELE